MATLSNRLVQVTVETLIVESHKYVSLVGRWNRINTPTQSKSFELIVLKLVTQVCCTYISTSLMNV